MSSKKQILIIDNQSNTLNFLVYLLEKESYRVQRVNSGQLGLRIADDSAPDLILVDLFMPDINGYDICTRLKRSLITKDIPVIFISFSDDSEQKVKAFQCGAVDYIQQPFRDAEVVARISHQITIRQLQQQLQVQNQSLEKEIAIRQITETALRESEEKYRVLVESSQDIIWTTDNEGIYTYVSPAARRIYGYAPEEMVGRSWREFLSPTAPDREIVAVDGLDNKNNNLMRWEGARLAKDGRIVSVLINAVPLVGEQGQMVGVTGTYTDITALKQAEESLRRNEAELRALFAAMQDVVLVRDRMGRCLKVAPTNPINLYKPVDQLLGATLHQVLPLAVADQILATIQHVLATGKTSKIEYCLEINERQVWFDSTISPLDENSVILVGRNISDRKQAEAILTETAHRDRALTTAIQRIRQSLDLETIFNSTVQELRQVIKCDRVLIYRFNHDWSGKFVAESIDPTWISLVQSQQYDRELTKNSLDMDDCAVIKIQSEVQDTRLQDTEGGAYRKGVSYLAVEDIYSQGFSACYINLLEKFQARAYLTVPIFLGDRLWGLLGSYQNSAPRSWKVQEINTVLQISLQLGVALQQAELLQQTQQQAADLRQAVVAADAANRAKSEFLANMSHELRTPLNAILGFTQIMSSDIASKNQGKPTLSEEYQQYIQIINRAGSHLLDLINDVLEMSKIEAGKSAVSPNAFNLKDMLANVEAMFRLKAKDKGLDLIFNTAADLPEFIVTDESKLRQVLINLLGNAIKFTAQGQVSLHVTHRHITSSEVINNAPNTVLEATALGAIPDLPNSPSQEIRLFFDIADTGLGITAEEMPLLFQVFRQTATGRKSQQGTGLGLPISRQYVQMLGGDIVVQSSPSGSCFSFAIDATLTNSFLENAIQPQGEVLGLAPGQDTYRILVVDDVPENRLLVAKILGKVGFAVAEAENGLQAVGLWQSWHPHLILMDIRMPVLDGYGAAKAIRDLEQEINQSPAASSPKTIILALTASAFQEQKQVILAAGCDDIIIKPLQSEILLNKIAQYLKIEYIYQHYSSGGVVNQSTSDSQEVNLAQLQIFLRQQPAAWLAKIQQAAVQGNDELIVQLVQQLPVEQETTGFSQYEELAITLSNLARNFQFEKIIEIIHQV